MAGKNILIVDDDNKAVRTMIGALETKGYAVFASDSKGAAVEISRKIRPSLVFVNAILSDASGLEVTRALRALDFMKDVPIIMLTEIDEEFSERYKSTYGIVSFLKKPIDAKDLLRKTSLYVMLDTRPGEGAPEEEAEEVVIPDVAETMGDEELDMAFSLLEGEQGQERDYGEIDLEDLGASELRDDEGEEFGEEPEGVVLMEDHPEPDHPLEDVYEELMPEKEAEESLATGAGVEPPGIPGDSEHEMRGKEVSEEPRMEETASGEPLVKSAPEATPSRTSTLSINRGVLIGVPVAVVALLMIVWYISSTDSQKETSVAPKGPETAMVQEEGKPEPLPQESVSSGSSEAPVVSLPQLPAAQEPGQEGAGVAQQEPSVPMPSGRTESPTEKPREASDLKPGYYVQVGAFGVRENAEKLYGGLKSKKYDVSIKRDVIKGKTMYRVLIGRYGTRASALSAMKRITAEEKINATLYRAS